MSTGINETISLAETDTLSPIDETRRRRILEGATRTFLNYGFQRTTMDDIARAAEMSRPALYLVFRNKTEIYRALAAGYLEGSLASARQALEGEGKLAERLEAAVAQSVIAMAEEFANAPHGAEILDMKNSLAGDIIATWFSAMRAAVAEAIERELRLSGVDLAARGHSPEGLAALFWHAVDGIKANLSDTDEKRAAVRALADLVARAVQP